MPFLPQYSGGVCLPQVYCIGLNGAQNAGRVAFTDDLIYVPLKDGLCQVVVLVDCVDEVGPAVSALAGLSQLSQRLGQEDESLPSYRLTQKWKTARQPNLFELQHDQNLQQT
jgi:hypothetical protein